MRDTEHTPLLAWGAHTFLHDLFTNNQTSVSFLPQPQAWLFVPVPGLVEGSARTVETAPASDVAGFLVGQDGISRREAGDLDCAPKPGTS